MAVKQVAAGRARLDRSGAYVGNAVLVVEEPDPSWLARSYLIILLMSS